MLCNTFFNLQSFAKTFALQTAEDMACKLLKVYGYLLEI